MGGKSRPPGKAFNQAVLFIVLLGFALWYDDFDEYRKYVHITLVNLRNCYLCVVHAV